MTLTIQSTRQARHFYSTRNESISAIVLHTPEHAPTLDFPVVLGNYFANVGRKASTHLGIGPIGYGRYLRDSYTAFGAAGVNARALHAEIAGFAAMKRADWLSTRPLAVFEDAGLDTGPPFEVVKNTATLFAGWARVHQIPLRMLTAGELQNKTGRGFTTHAFIDEVLPSTGHTDPGTDFPIDVLFDMIEKINNPAPTVPNKEEDMDYVVKGKAPGATQLQWHHCRGGSNSRAVLDGAMPTLLKEQGVPVLAARAAQGDRPAVAQEDVDSFVATFKPVQ